MTAATESPAPQASAIPLQSGLVCLAMAAGHYRLGADPDLLAHELGLGGRPAETPDILRAARTLGLRAKVLARRRPAHLPGLPLPAIFKLADGTYALVARRLEDGRYVVVRNGLRTPGSSFVVTADQLAELSTGEVILIARRLNGPGIDPGRFGMRWFLQSVWRYRWPLTHVILASLIIQIFALVTPIFFQVIVDKVLLHRSFSTLIVVVVGLAAIGLFDVTLQFLRAYVLTHTTSRIDVELGARLFAQLLALPLAYFESRPAGQTVARMRELDQVRNFLTGPALSALLDALFAVIFIAVLFLYSTPLTLVVLASIPVYLLIMLMARPALQDLIKRRMLTGAMSQQFLVETIVGIQTVKASAVEPSWRGQWEDRLAAYVKTTFDATVLAALGQGAMQYVSKATTAAVLFLGARAVIDGEMTVGGLLAFNMIMGQAVQPILRLSQLWQEFQQVQLSIERIGDILDAAPENRRGEHIALPPARGAITISQVRFRYQPEGVEVLRGLDLSIAEGEVIGIVGPSGSGKSTLTKLLQRLYRPQSGQILIDGMDIAQVDSAWLRRQIGVVLQENLLFNMTIHDNIALANPAIPRAHVIEAARLAGADEFIARLPLGYDTPIEERGSNLSGGQRQRIAIARALITQPRILILDEATSALDYESERIIRTNLRRISRGRTVIIVAHRLAAVRDCDRIIAVADGLIVENGTHAELLRREGGVYAGLWRLQSDAAVA